MTDSTPVRRYTASDIWMEVEDHDVPDTVQYVLASDFDRLQTERDSLRALVRQYQAREKEARELLGQPYRDPMWWEVRDAWLATPPLIEEVP